MGILRTIKSFLYEIYVRLCYTTTRSIRQSIRVKSADDTVKFIIENRCSVSRYGDGELSMIYNLQDAKDVRKSNFQAFNVDMAKRLEDILEEGYNESDNHYVALPGCMFSIGTGYLRRAAATAWHGFTYLNIRRTTPMLNPNIQYLETNFTRFYLSHKDKSGCRDYIEKVKKIWTDRDVVIVEGEHTCLGVGNDLFDSARSLKRVLCPAINAWDKYDEILHKSKEVARQKPDSLILCALGMTATVLARDLAHAGFQAIDLGHIDIEYEWMLRNATEKIAIPGKYTNEVIGGNQVEDIKDEKYLSQIVAKV